MLICLRFFSVLGNYFKYLWDTFTILKKTEKSKRVFRCVFRDAFRRRFFLIFFKNIENFINTKSFRVLCSLNINILINVIFVAQFCYKMCKSINKP